MQTLVSFSFLDWMFSNKHSYQAHYKAAGPSWTHTNFFTPKQSRVTKGQGRCGIWCRIDFLLMIRFPAFQMFAQSLWTWRKVHSDMGHVQLLLWWHRVCRSYLSLLYVRTVLKFQLCFLKMSQHNYSVYKQRRKCTLGRFPLPFCTN